MQFVQFDRETVEWDHRPFLSALESIGPALPPGARAFITDPAHFNFGRYRIGEEIMPEGSSLCPKDLLLIGIEVLLPGLGVELWARFTFPGYPPERSDLVIRYVGVRAFSFEDLQGNDSSPGSSRLGRWIVDEVAPIRGGVRHRIEFEDGALTIESFDLEATWR